MASSDDEGETFPDAISEYAFYDKDDDPLSFSKLPVQWNESESLSANAGPIFLRGDVDNGLGKFYQQVKAWKYDILRTIPEISVLSKDNRWIKLEKPRKSYENLIRSILISVNCLCFFKSKPDASGKSLWDHLSKIFSLYDTRPSENDLIDQINFLREAVKRDETLSKSKFLATFLENPRKKNSLDEDAGAATKPSFIVDDINGEMQEDDIITNETEDSESDDEDDPFDSVCAICDNGGGLTCCEGKCFRSFHASTNSEEAQDSNCESLCLTSKELELLDVPSIQYKCENCRFNIHQCFVCGQLGSSEKSSNTEVFRCSSATCGHFYHPKCIAKLLQKNDTEQQTLKEKIAAGEPFICPAHKCAVCKQTENEKVKDLQFAVCRRCPKSYHRKCLPRDIMFEHQIDDDDDDDDDDDVEVRAWDGLLTKSRALIYCLDHEIDPDLSTPVRTIIFRNILNRKTEQPHKKKLAVKVTVGDSVDTSKKKSVLPPQKSAERSSAIIKPDSSSKKRVAVSSRQESLKRKKLADASKNLSRKSLTTKLENSNPNHGQPSLGSRLFDLCSGTESNNLEKDETSIDDNNQTQQTEVLPLDDESKQRIMALMREVTSSITLDEVKKYHQGKVPSTHSQSSKVDKNIILARVEGSIEAVNVAIKKLEEGCSVEEAMAFCEPGVIDQLMRWKDRLRVYLAPFLHGKRYTSFGRHFTKVEKLEQIVDKLHWYVEDGDTIVDFCCGANDFSCLMKNRLDETGKKKCSYKNFDIAPTKNDFNFEKKDWMKVTPKELPTGSRLIMGLNPPFGKRAALANKFIDKALKFKPKLIILIVPPGTERLDSSKRKPPYDLIWEDGELLAGKSFYLPGSVDVNGKQVDQWNNIAPPLYLWSRPDWTNKHKSLSWQHGHTPQSDENGTKSGLTVGKMTQVQQPPQSIENGTKSGLTVGKTTQVQQPPQSKENGTKSGLTVGKTTQVQPQPQSNENGTKSGLTVVKTTQVQQPPQSKENGSKSGLTVGKTTQAQPPPQSNENGTKSGLIVGKTTQVQPPPQSKEDGSKSGLTVGKTTQVQPPPQSNENGTKSGLTVGKTTQVQPPPQSSEIGTKSGLTVGKTTQVQQPPQSSENGTKLGLTVGKSDMKDGSVVNKDSKTAYIAKTPKNKKRKKVSPDGSETKSKQIIMEGKGNQNSNKNPRLNEEIKIKQHDVRDSNRQDLAQKFEVQAPAEPQKREAAQALVEVKKDEKTRVAVKAHKQKKRQVPVEAQKHEKTQDPIEAQKHELTRIPSRKIEVQKHDATPVPSREVDSHKHETSWATSREIEDQKHEKKKAISREIEAQKHEKARASSREIEVQKHEKSWASPPEIEVQKHEKSRASLREFEVQKHEKARASPREFEAKKFENKHASPHTREDKVHETLNTDFSFVDVDQPFDQHSGGRYNSAIDESTFSLQNDLGQSYGEYLPRRYASAGEEPYMGSTSHRRPDGANHVAPSYSVRPDHLQYSAYDRVVGRAPFPDETGARVSGGGYSMVRYEPGLTRQPPPDTTPYNRTSTSATQRYAPRLDELNHTRVNNLGRSELDEMNHVRMGGMGRAEPPMGSRGLGSYRPTVSGPGYRVDPMGFALGLYHPYQQNSSGGWLNE